MLVEDIVFESFQWGLFALAPLLAFFTAKGVYNAICTSRQREHVHEGDGRRELEFRQWWCSVMAHRGIRHIYCPMPLEHGELCYAYSSRVSVYVPDAPSVEFESSPEFGFPPEVEYGTGFDVPCGVSVGQNWSVLDWFPSVSFRGHCNLCVTNGGIILRGSGLDIRIALVDVHTVASSCSTILIGSRSHELPLLLASLNGQIVRDVLHILIEDNASMMPG